MTTPAWVPEEALEMLHALRDRIATHTEDAALSRTLIAQINFATELIAANDPATARGVVLAIQKGTMAAGPSAWTHGIEQEEED